MEKSMACFFTKSLSLRCYLFSFIAICCVLKAHATYTLPGLQSLNQLETSNPEIQNISNIKNAAAGYCLNNSATNYVHFYPQLNPQNPFQNCNGQGKFNFGAINMTLMARINLISLTTDGFSFFSSQKDFSDECRAQFPDYCYFVMWFFNVQAGFRCVNDGTLLNGSPVQPSCRSSCQDILLTSCPMFKSALIQPGESNWMLCEYFSNSDCFSSASFSWIPKRWMILLSTFPLLLQLLL